MLILDRYVTQEVFKFFGIIIVTVIGIFLAIDFFEKIDNFIDASRSASTSGSRTTARAATASPRAPTTSPTTGTTG